MSLRINDEAPDFTAETSQGTIHFRDWIGQHETNLAHYFVDAERHGGENNGTAALVEFKIIPARCFRVEFLRVS
jgi:hypothetical protein